MLDSLSWYIRWNCMIWLIFIGHCLYASDIIVFYMSCVGISLSLRESVPLQWGMSGHAVFLFLCGAISVGNKLSKPVEWKIYFGLYTTWMKIVILWSAAKSLAIKSMKFTRSDWQNHSSCYILSYTILMRLIVLWVYFSWFHICPEEDYYLFRKGSNIQFLRCVWRLAKAK